MWWPRTSYLVDRSRFPYHYGIAPGWFQWFLLCNEENEKDRADTVV